MKFRLFLTLGGSSISKIFSHFALAPSILLFLRTIYKSLRGSYGYEFSSFRAVKRSLAVLENVLEDLENKVAGLLHHQVDAKKPDNDGKEILAGVWGIAKLKEGSNTFPGYQP